MQTHTHIHTHRQNTIINHHNHPLQGLTCQLFSPKELHKRDYILQKRPIISRSPLIVATPPHTVIHLPFSKVNSQMCVCMCMYTYIYIYIYILYINHTNINTHTDSHTKYIHQSPQSPTCLSQKSAL